MKYLWGKFSGFSIIARVVITLALLLLVAGLATRLSGTLHYLIFGNTEASAARGETVVAKEQTKAEANIADQAVGQVHERDVYREHVTQVVHDSEGKVNGSWKGERVGKDVDAAGADALCRLHDSLCRGPRPAPVQPVR